MTTYYCKCGRTFQKNTAAATTGNRMPDYGPEHECWGCPYAYETWVRNYGGGTEDRKLFECRASQTIRYDTTATIPLDNKNTGSVFSLDLDFLHQVWECAIALDGMDTDQYAFSAYRPSDYMSDGRYRLPLYPAANRKGVEAKEILFQQFFNEDSTRKDMTPEQEKALVLARIQKAKEEAQSLLTEDTSSETLNSEAEVTPDATNSVLDNETPENGTGFEGIDNNPQETGAAPAESEPVPDAPTGDSKNNDIIEFPCDWKNASGADAEEAEDNSAESDTRGTGFPAGERVSLRDGAFAEVLNACDTNLNQALRVAVQAKQGFTLQVKLTFAPRGPAFAVDFESGYQFDPVKYKDKGVLQEEIPVQLDEYGNPIIPYDRERQIRFEDLREPGATVTTDSSGVVQSVAFDNEMEAEQAEAETDGQSAAGESETDQHLESNGLFPCHNYDCPFYGVEDSGSPGCYFNPDGLEDCKDTLDLADALREAAEFWECTRDCVLAASRKLNGVTDVDNEMEEL